MSEANWGAGNWGFPSFAAVCGCVLCLCVLGSIELESCWGGFDSAVYAEVGGVCVLLLCAMVGVN